MRKTLSTELYVKAFKELIDEVIRENKNNPQRAKELIVNEVLREAKKAFKPQHYQEIKQYAIEKLIKLGISLEDLELEY
jgi:polyhydroxyalkanoate synthesis regulator phasin